MKTLKEIAAQAQRNIINIENPKKGDSILDITINQTTLVDDAVVSVIITHGYGATVKSAVAICVAGLTQEIAERVLTDLGFTDGNVEAELVKVDGVIVRAAFVEKIQLPN